MTNENCAVVYIKMNIEFIFRFCFRSNAKKKILQLGFTGNKSYSEKTADFHSCFGSPNHKLNSFCWYFFIITEKN